MVDDEGGNVQELLCALDHLIDMHAASVPAVMVKERNLKAKLIVAELREWTSNMPSQHEAITAFSQMIQSLKTKS